MIRPNVSFSLFEGVSENFPRYDVGAEKNIIQYKHYYPDWEIRIFYHRDCISLSVVEKLKRLGAILIDVKDIKVGKKETICYPYFWRFFSFFEDGPAISRDLDSRVSTREITYNNRWLQSEFDYFFIRDHPWQAKFSAGLVGMRNNGEKFKSSFIDFVDNQPLTWGADQEIFIQYMQNVNENSIYHCCYDDPKNYIPRDDLQSFIGIQVDEHDVISNRNSILALSYINDTKSAP